MSSELPPPDLKDNTGRLRRLVIAMLLGGAAAGITFFICDSLAKPDEMPRAGVYSAGSISRAYGFVYYTTALVGGIVFSIALAVQNHLAKKKWRAERVPTAKVR